MSPASSSSSDDSEPISRPLGRCPLGLKQSGKAAALPAVPPAILGKLRRVQTWPPPEIPLGLAGDLASAGVQQFVTSSVQPPMQKASQPAAPRQLEPGPQSHGYPDVQARLGPGLLSGPQRGEEAQSDLQVEVEVPDETDELKTKSFLTEKVVEKGEGKGGN